MTKAEKTTQDWRLGAHVNGKLVALVSPRTLQFESREEATLWAKRYRPDLDYRAVKAPK